LATNWSNSQSARIPVEERLNPIHKPCSEQMMKNRMEHLINQREEKIYRELETLQGFQNSLML